MPNLKNSYLLGKKYLKIIKLKLLITSIRLVNSF